LKHFQFYNQNVVGAEGLGKLFLLVQYLACACGSGCLVGFFYGQGLSGNNKTLSGKMNVVLIKKVDFRNLVEMKYTTNEAQFDTRYDGGAKQTILDKVAVLWPTVCLIKEWTHDDFETKVVDDSNSESWPMWLK
jgi:hypothetical protein